MTGSAALLMEWGIVRGNDIYYMGRRSRLDLRRGAEPFPGIEKYPNEMVGYGRLCLAESIPD